MADKAEAPKPKSEPLLPLRNAEKKLDSLKLVKARAAMRTRRRIVAELENQKMNALEKKIAAGEASYDDADALTTKKK